MLTAGLVNWAVARRAHRTRHTTLTGEERRDIRAEYSQHLHQTPCGQRDFLAPLFHRARQGKEAGQVVTRDQAVPAVEGVQERGCARFLVSRPVLGVGARGSSPCSGSADAGPARVQRA